MINSNKLSSENRGRRQWEPHHDRYKNVIDPKNSFPMEKKREIKISKSPALTSSAVFPFEIR